MEKENYDYLLKLIIVGSSNIGKSCLLHHFLENKFKKGSTHTIGVEFGCKVIKCGQKTVKLQIWDTAGQERFRSMTKTYYRGAQGALILFDLTNTETYLAVEQWIKDCKDLARSDISICVVGNKKDLKQLRTVEMSEAAKFCQDQGVQYIETSALNGENVDESFNLITKHLLSKIEQGLINTEDLKPKLFTNINSKEKFNNYSSTCYCFNN